MAKVISPFGQISGKIGPYVFFNRDGQQLVRLRSRKRTRRLSPYEISVRAKFSLVHKLLGPFMEIIRYTFKSAGTGSPRNNAFKHFYKNIIGKYPDIDFDYENMLISFGLLYPAQAPKVTLKGTEVIFSWATNSTDPFSDPANRCIVVLYCPKLERCVYTLEGSYRKDGQYSIDAGIFNGNNIETWIAFIDKDMKRVSDSVYTGRFLIPKK